MATVTPFWVNNEVNERNLCNRRNVMPGGDGANVNGIASSRGDPFDEAKSTAAAKADLSRKGLADAAISGLLAAANAHPDAFTLSSCSGRIVVLREGTADNDDGGKVRKKGCKWILVSHDPVDADRAWGKVQEDLTEAGEQGAIVIKFEPFILHLQCRTLDVARRMHTIR